jgi:hypothetical protein
LVFSGLLEERLVTPLSSRERIQNWGGRLCAYFSTPCLPEGPTPAVAKQRVAAAEEEAVTNTWHGVMVMVDDGRHLLSLQRLDETQLGRVEVAIQKTQTAVHFTRSRKALAEALVTKNRTPILKLLGAIPIEWACPLSSTRKS